MAQPQNKFVFVTCGAQEHIETVHYSLAALKLFSNTEIVVVTDTARNEIPLTHTQILDIRTPVEYNHHQASIYLKTGLHKFLPKGFTYCYLDTDVIALSKDADLVFGQKKGSVTFAEDHCSLSQFSPHAVNCGCAEQNAMEQQELNELLQKYCSNKQITDPVLLTQQRELQQTLQVIKRNPLQLLSMIFRYSVSGNIFKLNTNFSYNKHESCWLNIAGQPVMFETPVSVINQIEKHSSWRWNRLSRRWLSPKGNDPALLQCPHLRRAIHEKFKVNVHEGWQHWNGGVFLFDDSGHKFMEAWHQNTLAVLNDPYWKTRDQGTLIATAWQLNMQHVPTLYKKFNFIAYFYNPALMLAEHTGEISSDALKTHYKPAFIHVFEQFGNADWDIWRWIENKLKAAKAELQTEKAR